MVQLHFLDGFTSYSEMGTPDGVVRHDFARAHEAAGDPGFAQSLPDTCWSCYAQAIAEAEAQKAAQGV